jgi:hypothetical protein
MKEFWQFEGPPPAIPEDVWNVPAGLPTALAAVTPRKVIRDAVGNRSFPFVPQAHREKKDQHKPVAELRFVPQPTPRKEKKVTCRIIS